HAQDGRIPERSAFGPETLHPLGLLPNVMLVEVIDGGARFRYRLVGTEITSTVGRDATGKFFDELYTPRTLKDRTAALRWVLRERRPLRTADHLDVRGKEYIGYEAFTAPLSGGSDDMVLVMVVMVRAAPETRGVMSGCARGGGGGSVRARGWIVLWGDPRGSPLGTPDQPALSAAASACGSVTGGEHTGPRQT